ncbi:molybdopterin-dependent oxidoreductase [Nocardiopsis sp. N85]|uniref:molybdopterin-dependent oxidoreductase n=1 Tax=Nocardiopsis sp. N85 TaxID=3029400 RepID=UPI00237F95D1|nr:molybdopterin-dependent oxidoreductase [Nocardiopsis sp. N85]MDE3725128.1 molybdopterin-dependent oxidoreductase [Nocardiopsis sp. N85]
MPGVTTKTQRTGRNRKRGRLLLGACAGTVTVVACAAAGELVAALVGTASPVVAVGDAVVDSTPQALAELAIALFGTADKVVLLSGIVIVLLVVGGVLGVVALRRPLWAYAGLGVFAAAGVAAVFIGRGGDTRTVIPVLAAAAVGALCLALLLRAVPDETAPAGVETVSGPGRRRFVLTALAVAAAAGTAGVLSRVISGFGAGASSRAALVLPEPAVPLPPLPRGTDLKVPGLTPFTTPNRDFYRIDTALTVPRPDAARWRLRVHGLVDRPFEIDMAELLDLPLREADITLACVSNQVGGDLIGNARWLGYPLADLLRRAGVHADADQILATSHDGWTCGTPTEVVMDGRDALLAVGMNGEPLPHRHGFPARTIVPGLYGFVSATKWITDIRLTRFADDVAYWAERGWAVEAPIHTMSRVDVPAPLSRVPAGEVVLAGVAWAQHRGVDAVEVRVDDGSWVTAELARVPGIDTWVQWVTEVTVEPGRHDVEVRATDATGRVQTAERAEPIPSGATGRHRIAFTAT